MEEIKGTRVIKNTKIAMGIVGITRWFFLGLALLSILAVLGLVFLPQNIFKMDVGQLHHLRIELSSVVQIDPSAQSPGVSINVKSILIPFAMMLLIVCGCLSQILKELFKILGQVAKAQPFAMENGRSLGLIGIYITAFAVLKPAAMVFFYGQIIEEFMLKGYHIIYKVDIFLVFVGFMVALLSQLFKYGSFLQTEFDETL